MTGESALQQNSTLQAIEKFNVQEFQTMGSSPWMVRLGGGEVKRLLTLPLSLPLRGGIICNLWFQVPFHWLIELFNRYALGKISRFIYITAPHNRYMIGQ